MFTEIIGSHFSSFWNKKLILKTPKMIPRIGPCQTRNEYFNAIISIPYESVGNESGPCVAGPETWRSNYLREGLRVP